MAFGQQSGPPATGRQLQQLTSLIVAAGHADLRDARGALGLSQRQAGGRFTREEADALIARLEGEGDGGAGCEPPPSLDLRAVSAGVLAAELQRRGWVVMEPER